MLLSALPFSAVPVAVAVPSEVALLLMRVADASRKLPPVSQLAASGGDRPAGTAAGRHAFGGRGDRVSPVVG